MDIQLMEEILHRFIWYIWQTSHYLQGFSTCQLVGNGISEASTVLPQKFLPKRRNLSRYDWKTRDFLKPELKSCLFGIHPWNLTWNLKRSPWKRRFLLETIIFRFHVKFRGSSRRPMIFLTFNVSFHCVFLEFGPVKIKRFVAFCWVMFTPVQHNVAINTVSFIQRQTWRFMKWSCTLTSRRNRDFEFHVSR